MLLCLYVRTSWGFGIQGHAVYVYVSLSQAAQWHQCLSWYARIGFSKYSYLPHIFLDEMAERCFNPGKTYDRGKNGEKLVCDLRRINKRKNAFAFVTDFSAKLIISILCALYREDKELSHRKIKYEFSREPLDWCRRLNKLRSTMECNL
jgi:hypothetical protein